MYIFRLYRMEDIRLSQSTFAFLLSFVKLHFSKKNTHFLNLNFKFVLVYYHAEMDLTRSADKVTPISRSTQGLLMLYYHLYSIYISFRSVLVLLLNL